MKVDYQIDTTKILSEEIRKSLSVNVTPASVAVKLALIMRDVQNLTPSKRSFNKLAAFDA